MQLNTSCAVNPDTYVAVKQIINIHLGTNCALKSLIFIMYIIIFHIRNSVRVVLLKAPCWRAKWAYVGIKWTHEMNPERVQLFRIYHVIRRSKTRTGFENHMLLFTRGRLVPRQPRAFKSITATQLRCRLISRLSSCHTFKSITAMQLRHKKCLITRHNIHCHL